MKKPKKTKNFLRGLFYNGITPERQAELNAKMESHFNWMSEHPDYKDRYGTDKSYWLQEIIDNGFNPIGITIMTCEETIIMKTKEEVEAALKVFKTEGWWYTIEQWEEARKSYIRDAYNGVEANAPQVYCLDDNYKDLIK